MKIEAAIGRLDPWVESSLAQGRVHVEGFFGQSFPSPIRVRLHAHRKDMDAILAVDWEEPGFKSECWMVASGTGAGVDLLQPGVWPTEACEHDPKDSEAMTKLLAHELVHVFHGQLNPSSDFSALEGLDWFVEGLATYASGQLDSHRLKEVRAAVSEGRLPDSLDKFWSGPLRYGLSGSVVAWIDQCMGREKLMEFLVIKKKDQLLKMLGTSELDLLSSWRRAVLDPHFAWKQPETKVRR
jgi:hypothetical protein